MPYLKKITGKRCYLAPPEPEDAATWARWENDLGVAIPLGDEACRVSSEASSAAWISRIQSGGEYVFNIVTLLDEKLVGRILLFNINHIDRTAMVGLMIGEREYQRQGYGTEALRLMLDYAFNLLNLNSIMLGTYAFNEPALACYRKVGFKEIGRRRQARIIAGKAYDAVLMDILASEFESPTVASLLDDITSSDNA